MTDASPAAKRVSRRASARRPRRGQAAARRPRVLRADRDHHRLFVSVAELFHARQFPDDGHACRDLRHSRDRHAAGHPQRRHRPVGRIDARALRRRRGLPDAGRDAERCSASCCFPPVWVVAVLACALGAFVGADQRRADRAIQGAGLRRDARRDVCGARRRAADDQRPDLQQSRRPAGTRQHRLRLARLQPPVRRSDRRAGAGGHRHHRQRRAEPHGLRSVALCLRRQRARGRALRRAGEDGAGLRLRPLRAFAPRSPA